jgi:hypothetical protein
MEPEFLTLITLAGGGYKLIKEQFLQLLFLPYRLAFEF